MKKVALLFTILCIDALNGENIPTISPSQMQNKDQAHRELLEKVKKLEGYDVYVGAGYSDAGEQMFFAMEKLDDQNAQVWENYVSIISRTGGIADQLKSLSVYCDDQEAREYFKDDVYKIKLMDVMCPNKEKFFLLFEGTKGGTSGFKTILAKQKKGGLTYVAYASPQPVTGLFKPKKEMGEGYPDLKTYEEAYSNIIISIGVDIQTLESPSTEHRGVFKNPLYEIYGTYKNIWLKLHGWAGAIEEQ